MKKERLLRYLKLVNLIQVPVGVPREYYNNLQIFIEMCAINGIDIPRFFTFIFCMGYEMFENFYHQGDINSIPEMLTVVKYMRDMFIDVMKYQGKEWFLDARSVKLLFKLQRVHKLDIDHLYEWISEHKETLLGKSHLITPSKLEAIVEYYLQRDIKGL